MSAEQITLPFNLTGRKAARKKDVNDVNDDLIGRCFFDGASTINVIRTSPANPNQVIVQRDTDGKSWTVPAWLIRTVIGRRKKRRAA
ncbi:MAG: hypothetical protein WBP93_22535 [Pyrinomonadaceae bacterium]